MAVSRVAPSPATNPPASRPAARNPLAAASQATNPLANRPAATNRPPAASPLVANPQAKNPQVASPPVKNPLARNLLAANRTRTARCPPRAAAQAGPLAAQAAVVSTVWCNPESKAPYRPIRQARYSVKAWAARLPVWHSTQARAAPVRMSAGLSAPERQNPELPAPGSR